MGPRSKPVIGRPDHGSSGGVFYELLESTWKWGRDVAKEKRRESGGGPPIEIVSHKHRLCLYCDFQWMPPYAIRDHLEKCHPDVDPDVILHQADSTRRLCMYCDVEWNHTYEYKDHLMKHHPNVDPDAVLGEPPWSQRRDKIIARFTTTTTET
jgi:hypothetical protein